jgi:hypothetical protein
VCPCCRSPSQPVGGPLVLVGHGLIERQLCGPASPSGEPTHELLTLRRYRCRACSAVVVVGPRGLARRRWYRASAIALALAMYAGGATSQAARARTSPSRYVGASALDRWITLTRWIESARCGELFGVTGLGGLPRRRVAEHVALALAARAGRRLGDELTESAYQGASIAA